MCKICVLCKRLGFSFDVNNNLCIDVLFFCSILYEQHIQWVQLDRLKEALKCNDTAILEREITFLTRSCVRPITMHWVSWSIRTELVGRRDFVENKAFERRGIEDLQ